MGGIVLIIKELEVVKKAEKAGEEVPGSGKGWTE